MCIRDRLTGGVKQLTDKSAELNSGAKQASEGAAALASGSVQLQTGVTALGKGIGELAAGSSRLTKMCIRDSVNSDGTKDKWTVAEGSRAIYVGAASDDLSLNTTVEVKEKATQADLDKATAEAQAAKDVYKRQGVYH